MRTSDDIKDFVAALIKAKADFKPVLRTTKGQVAANREYKYADLSTVIEATAPALTAHGLVVLQAIDADTSTLISRICHISGQWVESACPIGKYARPQELGSELSYMRRYSLLALLGIAQEDDDGATAQAAEKPAATSTPKQWLEPPAGMSQTPGWTSAGAVARAVAPALPTLTPPLDAANLISEPQRKRLYAIAKAHGWPNDILKRWLEQTGFSTSYAVTKEAYNDICAALEAGPPALDSLPEQEPAPF